MPELPEVETTKRGIEPHIIKKKINYVYIGKHDLRIKFNKSQKNKILNTKIVGVRRKAKYILVDFTNKHSLLIHLGMTGNLRVSNTLSLSKHDHMAFSLSSEKHLIFNDVRRFGLMLIVKEGEKIDLLENTGPDPFERDANYEYFHKKINKSKSTIKSILLNSKIISGIGNIYACEILFASKISPLKIGSSITQSQCKTILKNSKKILKKAINAGGTTLNDYLNVDAKPGYFKIHLNVYGRVSKDCRKCAQKIKRIIQNGRSTFFCSKCQLK